MNKAHVEHGVFVLVRQTSHAAPGQRIVALVGDEATIKKLAKKEGHYLLQPESDNPAHKPIYVLNQLSIQGVVVDVLKRS